MAKIYQNQLSNPTVSYYTPFRKLKNSQASTGSDGRGSDFPAESADIPDNFATTESPKLKFLFSVQFYPRSENISLPETGSDSMDDMIFALRRATRPNINGTYQDVNYYNYRTKVLTKIDYGSSPATLTFYDDNANRAINLVNTYLQVVSDIANMTIQDAGSLQDNTSTVGTLNNKYGPLAAIRVAQHSFDPNDPSQLQSIYYDYLNPKIININLDELDMTQSDVTNVEISFVYDSVNITIPGSGTDNVQGNVSVLPATSVSTGNAVLFNGAP